MNLSLLSATNNLPLSIMGSISRPGSLIFILIFESVILKQSFSFVKTLAVLICVIGIICTVQPWTDHDSIRKETCSSDTIDSSPIISTLNPPILTTLNDTQNDIVDDLYGKPSGKECGSKYMYNPAIGYVSVAINVCATVTILIFHKNKLADQNTPKLVFWAFVIGTPISGVATLIIEHNNLSVVWTTKTVLLVLGHGIGASSLTLFSLLANQMTSSSVVQLTSSLHIILLLIGQYTILRDINPGHDNFIEIAGVCIVFIGSGLIPIFMNSCNKNTCIKK